MICFQFVIRALASEGLARASVGALFTQAPPLGNHVGCSISVYHVYKLQIRDITVVWHLGHAALVQFLCDLDRNRWNPVERPTSGDLDTEL